MNLKIQVSLFSVDVGVTKSKKTIDVAAHLHTMIMELWKTVKI